MFEEFQFTEPGDVIKARINVTDLVQISYDIVLNKVDREGNNTLVETWNGNTSETTEITLDIPPTDPEAVAYLLSWACAAAAAIDTPEGTDFEGSISIHQGDSELGKVPFSGNTVTNNTFEGRVFLKRA